MSKQPPKQPPIIERIERAMVLLAYFIELDGDEHVPMFERFEAELKELRQAENVKARARKLLERHALPLTLDAITPNGAVTNIDLGLSPPPSRAPIVPSFLSAALTTDPAS